MNTLQIGLIATCAVGAIAGYFSLSREAADETASPQLTRVQAAPSAVLSTGDEHATPSRAADVPTEPLPDSDTTDVLEPPVTIDEMLNAFNADLGVEGVPVDREDLAAVLRADPELAKTIID